MKPGLQDSNALEEAYNFIQKSFVAVENKNSVAGSSDDKCLIPPKNSIALLSKENFSYRGSVSCAFLVFWKQTGRYPRKLFTSCKTPGCCNFNHLFEENKNLPHQETENGSSAAQISENKQSSPTAESESDDALKTTKRKKKKDKTIKVDINVFAPNSNSTAIFESENKKMQNAGRKGAKTRTKLKHEDESEENENKNMDKEFHLPSLGTSKKSLTKTKSPTDNQSNVPNRKKPEFSNPSISTTNSFPAKNSRDSPVNQNEDEEPHYPAARKLHHVLQFSPGSHNDNLAIVFTEPQHQQSPSDNNKQKLNIMTQDYQDDDFFQGEEEAAKYYSDDDNPQIIMNDPEHSIPISPKNMLSSKAKKLENIHNLKVLVNSPNSKSMSSLPKNFNMNLVSSSSSSPKNFNMNLGTISSSSPKNFNLLGSGTSSFQTPQKDLIQTATKSNPNLLKIETTPSPKNQNLDIFDIYDNHNLQTPSPSAKVTPIFHADTDPSKYNSGPNQSQKPSQSESEVFLPPLSKSVSPATRSCKSNINFFPPHQGNYRTGRKNLDNSPFLNDLLRQKFEISKAQFLLIPKEQQQEDEERKKASKKRHVSKHNSKDKIIKNFDYTDVFIQEKKEKEQNES